MEKVLFADRRRQALQREYWLRYLPAGGRIAFGQEAAVFKEDTAELVSGPASAVVPVFDPARWFSPVGAFWRLAHVFHYLTEAAPPCCGFQRVGNQRPKAMFIRH
jgi:hypothetical protein